MSDSANLYGGLTFCRLPRPEYDLSGDVVIRSVFAHIFSPYMMAFKRPANPNDPHPGPWHSLFSGFSFDIEGEVAVPKERSVKKGFDSMNLLWWISALLRMQHSVTMRMPAVFDVTISELPDKGGDCQKYITELSVMNISPRDQINTGTIPESCLEWIRKYHRPGELLMCDNKRFNAAFQSFDNARFCRNVSDGLLVLWGALERLFSEKGGELKYRVSNNIAAYLYPAGDDREGAASSIRKLYDVRSKAAHGSGTDDLEAYGQTFALLQRALRKMVECNSVPSIKDLEANVLDNRLWS